MVLGFVYYDLLDYLYRGDHWHLIGKSTRCFPASNPVPHSWRLHRQRLDPGCLVSDYICMITSSQSGQTMPNSSIYSWLTQISTTPMISPTAVIRPVDTRLNPPIALLSGRRISRSTLTISGVGLARSSCWSGMYCGVHTN